VRKPTLPHLERWFAEISKRPGFVKYLSAPMT
jgi:glutathione S-transferase